jgi:hypothetical protein
MTDPWMRGGKALLREALLLAERGEAFGEVHGEGEGYGDGHQGKPAFPCA